MSELVSKDDESSQPGGGGSVTSSEDAAGGAAPGGNTAAPASAKAPTQTVDPFTVESEGAIDYDYLIRTFGSQKIEPALIERIERVTHWSRPVERRTAPRPLCSVSLHEVAAGHLQLSSCNTAH